MEKIAIISDIHSNLVALEAVLKDIEKRGINRIFCLGDIVFKGSSTCEVVDRIKDKCEIVIKGNCDDAIVNAPKESKRRSWYKEQLGEERIEYLKNLPLYKDFYMSGSYVRMFHATKNDLYNRIFAVDPIEKKKNMFQEEGKEPDIILYGDIHQQYMQKLQNKTIVNVGSVGNSVYFPDYDESITNMEETTQAFYCIIEGEYNAKERGSISIQFVRIPYDIEKEIELAKEKQIPDLEAYIIELTKAKYFKRANK
ncbi:MAG: metallophosphoesterase family protein [Clostridia bacterium]|uniref:metallophosphoesterase family protein n=1 Tax=Thomasclavelia cocleata TaxID=69824 RepID=UPI00272E18CD|nr:metallophosphoesterase family protein [Thomasclavelia cocleata]MCI8383840.1 metallophosphoesterase family protein [Clostridia bacterium]